MLDVSAFFGAVSQEPAFWRERPFWLERPFRLERRFWLERLLLDD
jgi:hypothetical protein